MDSSVIRSQLTTLKKRVKAHKEVLVSSDAAESKTTSEPVEDGSLEPEPQRPINADRDIPKVASQLGELSVSHIAHRNLFQGLLSSGVVKNVQMSAFRSCAKADVCVVTG